MEECAKKYLDSLGYKVNDKAQTIIKQCNDWYANETISDFHKRKTIQGEEYILNKMNFAKRICADDANLCEIISVVPEKKSKSEEFIISILKKNRFDVMYREQLERMAATGTVGAYIGIDDATYYDNGNISGGVVRITYCFADNIIPLTVVNNDVVEAAFCGENYKSGNKQTTLVIFTFGDDEKYKAQSVTFNANGKIIGEIIEMSLGDVKPFAIMRTAEVNNIKNMQGYGFPKVYNAIPVFKALDLCYNVLFSDLDKSEKIVLINELLCGFDDDGKPIMTSEQKKLFMLLGERLPEQKEVIQEYNPEIRIEQITKTFELVLSLLSMIFGYGTKKYGFENGQITTATEYIGERQDQMQELNKQRKQAEDYISDIVHAAEWFSNQFLGTNFDTEEILSIEFDDSYVSDKNTELERMRNDSLSFDIPKLKIWYLMDAYNLSEEEATELVLGTEKEKEQEEMDEEEDTD